MNRDGIVDAMGLIDEDMIQKVEALRNQNRKPAWIRWAAMVACFAAVLTASFLSVKYWKTNIPDVTEPTDPISGTRPIQSVVTDTGAGVYVDSKYYMLETELSEMATGDNVGNMVGYASVDNETVTEICAFAYLPDNGKTNRIIIPYKDAYYVYSFYCYEPNGSDSWPVDLLENAAYIEVQDTNYGTLNDIIYLTISDSDALTEMVTFLGGLNEKSSHAQLHRHYFSVFKDQFKVGEIWISQYGSVVHGGNTDVLNRFYSLVNGEGRKLAVVMEDHTVLTYFYEEGAGVIRCNDFGYILTDAQVEQINRLIGLT